MFSLQENMMYYIAEATNGAMSKQQRLEWTTSTEQLYAKMEELDRRARLDQRFTISRSKQHAAEQRFADEGGYKG